MNWVDELTQTVLILERSCVALNVNSFHFSQDRSVVFVFKAMEFANATLPYGVGPMLFQDGCFHLGRELELKAKCDSV